MALTNYITENLQRFVENQTITLYHFSLEDEEQLTLSPDQVGKKSWTKKEYRRSNYPRTFFYVDLEDRERFYTQQYTLYSVKEDATEIYDLTVDELGIIDEMKQETGGSMNFDVLFKKVHQEYDFSGMYYEPGSMKVIVWFEPITVEKSFTEKEKEIDGKYHPSLRSDEIVEIMNVNNTAMLSAERGDKSDQENKANTALLKTLLKTSSYHFADSFGGYVETYDDGSTKDVGERSFLVWSHPQKVDKDKFMNDMLSMAKRFKQESIMFKAYDSNDGEFVYVDGRRERVGQFKPNKKSEYFTKVGDFYFVFE